MTNEPVKIGDPPVGAPIFAGFFVTQKDRKQEENPVFGILSLFRR